MLEFYQGFPVFEFVLGISLALLILVIIAIVMNKASQFFLPHKVFFILTWMIYALAFKMLGVSVHALQLTNMAPNHLLTGFPTIDLLGIYPSWEGLVSQLVFCYYCLDCHFQTG